MEIVTPSWVNLYIQVSPNNSQRRQATTNCQLNQDLSQWASEYRTHQSQHEVDRLPIRGNVGSPKGPPKAARVRWTSCPNTPPFVKPLVKVAAHWQCRKPQCTSAVLAASIGSTHGTALLAASWHHWCQRQKRAGIPQIFCTCQNQRPFGDPTFLLMSQSLRSLKSGRLKDNKWEHGSDGVLKVITERKNSSVPT